VFDCRYARPAVSTTEEAPTTSDAGGTDLAGVHARYESAFEGVDAPFAFVDLDALGSNARKLLAQAAGTPIRIASKSVRSVEVLRRILALDDGFHGILAFTLPEALWLHRLGFEDLVVAYPTADREAIVELAARAAEDPAGAPVAMVDDTPHLDLVESATTPGQERVRVCLDLDVSWWPLRGRLARIGPKRSPVHLPGRAGRMARQIRSRPGLRLAGVMAYEGQIAGVGDDLPGQPARSRAIRAMQSASEREIRKRLPRMVAAVRSEAGEDGLEFVNGGGTGSLARTAAAGIVTELTAGSGFYAPGLFDHYRSLDLTPAAFFTLPVVRRPSGGVATALGGGYLASGPADALRLPQPYLPDGLSLDRDEGAGEVQTPLHGDAARPLELGDRVYMRHAKAGELCERFNSLYLVEGDRIVDEVPTYRGDGKAFL
jgi:D-serine deaminase-like pyridoxal phosphate-dependent protein